MSKLPNTLSQTESELNACLSDAIYRLCSNRLQGDSLENEVKFFINLYQRNPNFRHEYSGISNAMKAAVMNDKTQESLLTIQLNFLKLKETIEQKYNPQEIACQKFHKLYDHVMLEASRQIERQDLTRQLEWLNNQYQHYNQTFEKHAEQFERISQQIDESKSSVISQTVTVLGIFTAIAMAFFGGFKLLEAGITVDSISIYRLCLILLLIGFSVYNIIVGLMFVIARICGKDIGVRCKVGDFCNGCEYRRKWSIILCQSIHKYPFITVVEFLFIYLLYAVVILWLFTPGEKCLLPGVFPMDNIWVASIIQVVLLILPLILFVLLCKLTVKKSGLHMKNKR